MDLYNVARLMPNNLQALLTFPDASVSASITARFFISRIVRIGSLGSTAFSRLGNTANARESRYCWHNAPLIIFTKLLTSAFNDKACLPFVRYCVT